MTAVVQFSCETTNLLTYSISIGIVKYNNLPQMCPLLLLMSCGLCKIFELNLFAIYRYAQIVARTNEHATRTLCHLLPCSQESVSREEVIRGILIAGPKPSPDLRYLTQHTFSIQRLVCVSAIGHAYSWEVWFLSKMHTQYNVVRNWSTQ